MRASEVPLAELPGLTPHTSPRIVRSSLIVLLNFGSFSCDRAIHDNKSSDTVTYALSIISVAIKPTVYTSDCLVQTSAFKSSGGSHRYKYYSVTGFRNTRVFVSRAHPKSISVTLNWSPSCYTQMLSSFTSVCTTWQDARPSKIRAN